MKRTKQGNSSICECEMQDQKKKELYPKVENLKKGQSNWSSHLISSLRIKIIIVVSKVSTTTSS